MLERHGLSLKKDGIVIPPTLLAAFQAEPSYLETLLMNYPWASGEWESKNKVVGTEADFVLFCKAAEIKLTDRDVYPPNEVCPNSAFCRHVLEEHDGEDYLGPFVVIDQNGNVSMSRGDIIDFRETVFGPEKVSIDDALAFSATYRQREIQRSFNPESLPVMNIGLADNVGFGEFVEAYDKYVHYEHWSQKPEFIREGQGFYLEDNFYRQLLDWMRRKGLLGENMFFHYNVSFDVGTGGLNVSVMGEGVEGCPYAFYLYSSEGTNPGLLEVKGFSR